MVVAAVILYGTLSHRHTRYIGHEVEHIGCAAVFHSTLRYLVEASGKYASRAKGRLSGAVDEGDERSAVEKPVGFCRHSFRAHAAACRHCCVYI